MDREDLESLVNSAEKARAIDDMIKTIGWQKVACPKFERIKEKALQTLLTTDDDKEMYRAREKIRAIEEVMSDLMFELREGEQAAEELRQMKE